MTNERPFHEQYEVRASNGNQVLEDLTAARARIAELDSMLDRSCSAYQDDIEKLSARIAELEDWQRRAVRCLCDDTVDCDCPVVDGCDWCRARNSLVEEATR